MRSWGCPKWGSGSLDFEITLNSVYNEVAFNKKSVIPKENLCTKYFPFTYKYVTLNESHL